LKGAVLNLQGCKKEYSNIDEYNISTDEKKQFMIKYQMVPASIASTDKNK